MGECRGGWWPFFSKPASAVGDGRGGKGSSMGMGMVGWVGAVVSPQGLWSDCGLCVRPWQGRFVGEREEKIVP